MTTSPTCEIDNVYHSVEKLVDTHARSKWIDGKWNEHFSTKISLILGNVSCHSTMDILSDAMLDVLLKRE